MRFDAIKALYKRAAHFAPGATTLTGERSRLTHPWAIPLPETVPASGIGVTAHNYAAMQNEGDSHLDRLLWLDSVAGAFNRYIDHHRAAGDEVVKSCLAWWRDQLFLDPTYL